jgi:hypothetical protein
VPPSARPRLTQVEIFSGNTVIGFLVTQLVQDVLSGTVNEETRALDCCFFKRWAHMDGPSARTPS